MRCYCASWHVPCQECSHKIKIEFEEIKRTATVKQLHLFCFDEAFTHQVGYIYVFDSHTVELKCMSLPLSLSLSCLSFFSSTKLFRKSLLSRNALSQTQLTENNTNTARANLIELARDLLLSNFIISEIKSLEKLDVFLFAFASFASLSS